MGALGVPFWALCLLLLLVFMTGGASRADVSSLVVLRPAAALLLGLAFWGLTPTHLRDHRFVFAMAAAAVGLVSLQLIPLPAALWGTLPGRGVIVAIDEAAGLGAVWRPISLVPSATWNALFALIPPVAALVLAARIDREGQWWVAGLIVAIGVVSALIALLQLGGGDPHGPLYFYRVTNDGSAVGLFANRNHQAVFLASLFPLLAALASAARPSRFDARLRAAGALAIGVFLVPLILITGSRNGVVTLGLGLLSIPFLYTLPGTVEGKASSARRKLVIRAVVAALFLALVAVTAFLGRAVALSRIVDPTAAETIRFRAWGPMFSTAMDYFPLGGGFGAFPDLFKIREPDGLLATTIFAHAHNDWLELLITGGLPALLLLGIAMAGFVLAAVRWWPSYRRDDGDGLLGGAGLWMVLIFAVASSVDYPLRVPSLACLFCVTVLWISSFASGRIARQGV